MSRFSKGNFIAVIREIEAMEQNGENIWVPVGILEYMYDDTIGYIDQYFHTSIDSRDDVTILWNKLLMQLRQVLTSSFIDKY